MRLFLDAFYVVSSVAISLKHGVLFEITCNLSSSAFKRNGEASCSG